jgi:hypothetical protein
MLDLWEGGTVKLPNLDCLQGYKLTELERDQVGCEGFEPKRLLVKSCPACTFSILSWCSNHDSSSGAGRIPKWARLGS